MFIHIKTTKGMLYKKMSRLLLQLREGIQHMSIIIQYSRHEITALLP